jgi:hypothetical protein
MQPLKEARMARQRKKRGAGRGRQKPRSLSDQYAKYFVPASHAIDKNTGGSLEQPSPFKTVPSVVTYSIGETPLVASHDA